LADLLPGLCYKQVTPSGGFGESTRRRWHQ
jgi:hypothetical protein